MIKKRLFVILGILFVFLVFSCTREPVETTFTLYGLVLSSKTDEPIKGAMVTVVPGSVSVLTGTDGTYEISSLDASNSISYSVNAQKEGYYTNRVVVGPVAPGKSYHCPILLTPIE